MRGEKEMFDLILNFAKSSDLIKAVILNGSRANPNAEKDDFMDYDIVFVVDKVLPFIEDKSFTNYFGDILIMQEPDNPDLFTPEISNKDKYTYLMQFTDGSRIDLTFANLDFAKKICLEDSQTVILMDKSKSLPKIPPPSDSVYVTKKSTKNEFLACSNEFWWLSTYIAKGLWRKQIIYALEMFTQNVHPEFMKMIRWYIGLKNNFSVNSGNYGKYFEKFLPNKMYRQFLKTYPGSDGKDIYSSLKIMCRLFDNAAKEISDNLDFGYSLKESEKVMRYIFKS